MKRLLLLCLVPLAGCLGAGRLRGLAPLESEGEVYLYLEPFPGGSEPLAFRVMTVSAITADGRAAPLEVTLPDVSARTAAGERRFAWGRLAPGSYSGFEVQVKRAQLDTEEGTSDLLVSPEPIRISASYVVARQKATLLRLSFTPADAVKKGFSFAPTFAVSAPDPVFAEAVGYCSSTGAHDLVVFDKRARRVVGVVPTGRAPMGIAIDAVRRRAYVALSGEDQVSVLDVQTSEEIGRIPLLPGDAPQELGLSLDGRTLMVVNAGSNTAAFLDPAASMEIARVPTGNEPVSFVMDRAGQRAYVFNRRSANMTVVDVPNRAVVATAATDPEPLQGRFNRAGDRLYVVSAGSSYLTVYSVPDLTVLKRVFVGLGASALEVDARTDLIYVGDRLSGQLRIFDPISFLPVSRIEVPGVPTLTAIDDVENLLYTVAPRDQAVGINDLVSGKSLPGLDVGREPYQVTVVGARR